MSHGCQSLRSKQYICFTVPKYNIYFYLNANNKYE